MLILMLRWLISFIEENLIEKQAENLEKVEKMLSILNSEHIKGIQILSLGYHFLSLFYIFPYLHFGDIMQDIGDIMQITRKYSVRFVICKIILDSSKLLMEIVLP